MLHVASCEDEMGKTQKTSLKDLENGRKARIVTLPSGESRRRLEALGLREGKLVEKVSGMPFHGPVTIIVDGRQIAIGWRISSRVEVEPLLKNDLHYDSLEKEEP
ncbi:FeoA family protein [Aminobacterium mobile]|jgi:ferrous iron transport protein A|uniref:FeoA family protein n=2 Tax=Aminobacteriaceae TaxID=3029087 RepID=UPI002FE130D4